MHVEASDLRRLPVPVLTENDAARLDVLGRRAIDAKVAVDRGESGESLSSIEVEIDGVVRDLYDVRRDADLWVAR